MDLTQIKKILFKILGFKKSFSFSKEETDLAEITPWAIGRNGLNPRCTTEGLGTGCCTLSMTRAILYSSSYSAMHVKAGRKPKLPGLSWT